MKIVYAHEPIPDDGELIFLAGPTPRDKNVESWRPKAIELLQTLGFDGYVLVPESSDGQWKHDYDDQIEWEEAGLKAATCIMFWVPRDLKTMPAFTTNDEWGYWKESGKVVFGAPEWAERVRYQLYYVKKLSILHSDTLEGTIKHAMSLSQARFESSQ